MTRVHVLLCVLLVACGAGAVGEDAESLQERLLAGAIEDGESDETSVIATPFESVVRACYGQSVGSPLQVHTVGRYLALGETMLIVRVSIPEAPRLARCIEEAVGNEAPPGAGQTSDALASGSFAIDLGGPPPPMGTGDIERQFEEHEQETAALMREAVKRGVLAADHPLVQQVLDPLGSSD